MDDVRGICADPAPRAAYELRPVARFRVDRADAEGLDRECTDTRWARQLAGVRDDSLCMELANMWKCRVELTHEAKTLVVGCTSKAASPFGCGVQAFAAWFV